MGNVLSSASARERATKGVLSDKSTMDIACDINKTEKNEEVEEFYDTFDDNQLIDDKEARAKAKEEEMIAFHKQLDIKREIRKQILTRHRTEKEELEKSLEKERKSKLQLYESNKQLREILSKNSIEIPEELQDIQENSELTNTILQMKDEFEKLKSNNNNLRKNLAESNNALQSAFSDIADLNAQNTESIKHINALKEVVTVSKTMINLREQQLNELKSKLNEIERSLADRETNMLSTDLRQEYERQLQNIRTLRSLYEERARLSEVTRLGLVRELEEQKLLHQAEVNKCKNLSDKVEELEATVDTLHEKIDNKNTQLSTFQDETRGLKSEMSVVNKLFSQVLLGYKTKYDLDKLVHRLEENHGILTHMAEKENGSEASTALPKLLLELISQVDDGEESIINEELETDKSTDISTESTDISTEVTECLNASNTTPEEIVQNLPKVWRVLMELLSHQNVTDANLPEKVTTCYKSVETKSGPVLVPSVSQTYIRLKDLIVEKLGLIKEVNRMKQLNGHLETRLEEQERRLCLVTAELSKTWHVVGRLRRHHHQLHTHEKILKYELQQKRKLLNELKEELEYCREKWIQAREKNSQSERDWRTLRAEFSSRKTKSGSPSLNNSAESGYSDERPSDDSSGSNDESEYVTESRLRCKKNMKSFETVLDSSTDFNPVAEREDPASDMLDVADLPLDNQDDSHNEDLLKSVKSSEETEDEIGDITNDSSIEVTTIKVTTADAASNSTDGNIEENIGRSTEIGSSTEPPMIDPKQILKNIKLQNERLAKKDERLENLEKNSEILLKKTHNLTKFSEQINSTLSQLVNRPSSSISNVDAVTDSDINNDGTDLQTDLHINEICSENQNTHIETKLVDVNIPNQDNKVTEYTISNNFTNGTSDSTSNSSCSLYEIPETSEADLKSFMEVNEEQDKSLGDKDEKVQNPISGCVEILDTDTNKENLDVLNSSGSIVTVQPTQEDNDSEPKEHIPIATNDNNQPSTSSEIDHEARFAARDIRLKRLEEQTKSLVNKVNKTTTKGVKIHYKLEELHNIYGSENSRAGTPSEENDDKTPMDGNDSDD
ncbi:interaptin [Achroia grisella]|uniref:interaptin n=1 Tax=Achroia grisella TaxID=688607 RepID=UPI0027D2AF50|nr:interaptin [Achroia grisella]